jgi:molybdopterin/thiamine biosynthesis adenylyltransferase
MKPTLVLREDDWREIVSWLEQDVESAGVILAGHTYDDELTLFGRSLGPVPEGHYDSRQRDFLDIRSSGVWPFFGAAERDSSIPIFVHTHPGASAAPSRRDAAVDEALRRPAMLRSRAPLYASLVVGGEPERPTFTGRVYNEDGQVAPLERFRIVGRRLRVLLTEGTREADTDFAIYDRQVRAFGKDGQKLLSRLRVGVVGAGGTGSAVFELLVRTGIRHLVLIDDDVVTATNLTRIHESGSDDAGRPKVDVLRSAAERIGLGTEVATVRSRVTGPTAASDLQHLDVIFGCTDDDKGRLQLSRLALTHLIPVFDMAFAIDPAEDGTLRALDGRVTTLLPGEACLLCRGRISPEGLAAEDLEPEERRRRAGEGYAPGLGENDPAVGVFTSLIGGLAVNELLDRLFGYSEWAETFQSSELVLRLADRRISYTSRPAKGQHWCADPALYGRGSE